MHRHRPLLFALLAAGLAAGLTSACSDTPATPEVPARLAFSNAEVALGALRSASVQLRNDGGGPAAPVRITPGPIRDAGGSPVGGATLEASPAEIPVLAAGEGREVAVTLTLGASLNPGRYDATLTASAPDDVRALVTVTFDVAAPPDEEVATLEVVDVAGPLRQGDVVGLTAEARNAAGQLLEGAAVTWSLEPADAGLLAPGGSFVGYRPGEVTVTARTGELSDATVLTVTERGLSGSFTVLGEAIETDRFTSDLWLHGDYAHAGTWGTRAGRNGTLAGNTLFTWRITDPSAPVRVHALEVDARTVNDVKVRADGTLAVLTHEGSADGQNGISILDRSNPAEPAVVARFTEGLESGVHNVWIEGDYVYVVGDGSTGLRIVDVSDPDSPTLAASYYAGSSFLHDVVVEDGLAILSHWNAGLVVLDVGNGIAGGSPTNPVEVSRLVEGLDGQTHNAWYWPEGGWVFVGEEDVATPGIMHVVDLRDPRHPRKVASFAVPGQTPHNFWLDEEREILYLAWYANGVRALDVSGELMGALDRQGREIASILYNGGGTGCNLDSGDTCSWAPQLHRGVVWVSDMNRGLVALTPP